MDNNFFQPINYLLEQNYPNPFNPSNKYHIFGLRELKEFVNLKVYDILGNEIATLVNEEKPARNRMNLMR